MPFCLHAFSTPPTLILSRDEAAARLFQYHTSDARLFSVNKIDGLLRGFQFPVPRKIFNAIAEQELIVRAEQENRPAEGLEIEKLAAIDKQYSRSPVELYVEVNLDENWREGLGQYLSVFWKQSDKHFKHVFSEYAAGAWDKRSTLMGVRTPSRIKEFAASDVYHNSLMDFYQIIFQYGGGEGNNGGVHMSSGLETIGFPSSAGCIRTRLAAAYKLFYLNALAKERKSKVIYNVVNDARRDYAPKTMPPFAVFWLLYKNLDRMRELTDQEKYEVLAASYGLSDELQVVKKAQGPEAVMVDGKLRDAPPLSHDERRMLYQGFFQRWDVTPYAIDELENLP